MPGSVRCQTCGDAGFVKRDDLPVTHRDFGAAHPCPACAGPTRARNLALEGTWFVERDQVERGAIRHRHGLTNDDDWDEDAGMVRPPEGFAQSGVPVPSTVSEEQRLAARARIARDVAALNGRMRMDQGHGG